MTTPKSNEKKRLTHRQVLALPHLIRDSNIERACHNAGITKKTFYVWLKDETFCEELKRLQDDILGTGMALLKDNVETACTRLIGLLNAENPSLVRQVANDIIGLVIKNTEMNDIIKRLEKLEEQ
jgi:hypothetical protein